LLSRARTTSVDVFIHVDSSIVVIDWMAQHCQPWRNVRTARCHTVQARLRELINSLVKPYQLLSMTKSVLRLHVDWLVPFVNADQLVLDELIVWSVLVFQFVDVVEDFFDLLDVLGLVPKKSFWGFKAAGLDVFYFFHCVLLNLSPNQFFFKEV
jgi:hypothetical protein